jgi:hypothetical protein
MSPPFTNCSPRFVKHGLSPRFANLSSRFVKHGLSPCFPGPVLSSLVRVLQIQSAICKTRTQSAFSRSSPVQSTPSFTTCQRSMRLVIEKHVTIMLKCGTERIHGADAERIWDKMRYFKFLASFLRYCVFDLCFFVMDATSY